MSHVGNTGRRTFGAALMDGLLVFALVVLVATLYWPQIAVDRVIAAESRVIDEVRSLAAELESHKDAGTTDADGDGIGEFPGLAVLLENDATGFERTRDPSTFKKAGYYFALRLPDTRFRPVRPASKRLLVDGAELTCLLVAWPSKPGRSGMRAYAWTPADGILKHTVDGYPYQGRSFPPRVEGTLLQRSAGALNAATNTDPRWVHPK